MKHSGFSLLELLIVIAIISILTLVSYSVYTQHVLKTRRSHAEIALLDLAAGLERYYVDHSTYVGVTLADAGVNSYTEGDHYQLVIAGVGATNYLLQAVPQGAQVTDHECGTLSLNEVGEKGVSGGGGVGECW